MSFAKWKDPKDPDDVKDYGINWAGWLGLTDTLRASVWIVPPDLTKESDSFTDTETTIWLSGGVAGYSYPVTNRITTFGGRTEDRTTILKVKEL